MTAIAASTARPSLGPSRPSRLSLLGAGVGRAGLLGSGWTRTREEWVYSVAGSFALFYSVAGVFSLRPCLGRAQCCSCPEVPGSGRPRLIVVTRSRAGSVLWAQICQCFPYGGIKRSVLFFDCLTVNPSGGHLAHSGFPVDTRLPPALQGLRRGLSWKCCWRQLELQPLVAQNFYWDLGGQLII